MLVITLTDCPQSLRGDLTKWLFEINVGVYVGRVSARVREELWKRIKDNVKVGRVTMVYRTNNEQGMAFRVHNSDWQPIDFDGLKLMMRPQTTVPHKSQNNHQNRYSHAMQRQILKSGYAKMQKASQDIHAYPQDYVIIDIETTGLSEIEDEIIEIGALKIIHGELKDTFQRLVICNQEIPEYIVNLTGIDEALLDAEGVELDEALSDFLKFIEDFPLIAHNIAFDLGFIQQNCRECDLSVPKNKTFDTLEMARRLYPKASSHKLTAMVEYLGFTPHKAHRSIADCENIWMIYQKMTQSINA